jgi:Phycobilisome degradation protein nblA
MNSSSFELSLEQEFQMKLFEQTIMKMNSEQMQDMLIQITRMMLIKDNFVRDLVKQCLIGPAF